MQFSIQKTIDTVSVLIVGALAVLEKVAGCSGDMASTPAVEAAKCSASYLSPAIIGYVTIAYTVLTTINRMTKAGGALGGLFGHSAVVSTTGTVGTVSPQAVVK